MSTRERLAGAWLVGALALVSGCAPTQHTCGEDQQARITGFVAELSAAIQASAVTLPIDVELPRVALEGGPVPAEGILVVLDREGLLLEGERDPRWRTSRRLDDEVLLWEVLAETRRQPTKPVLVAAIAADVPTGDVEQLLALAERAGLDGVVFVVEAADGPQIPAIPEPGLPAMIRERAGGDPSREPEVLGQLLEVEAERCLPLSEGSGHAPMTSLESRALAILEMTKDALLACRCTADVDRVLSLAHVFVAPTRVTTLSAERSFDGVAPFVAAQAGAPWSAVVLDIFALGARAPAPRKSFAHHAQEPTPGDPASVK